MDYTQAVAEARTLVKRSEDDQWRLAQLTAEVLDGGATYEQWANDLGVSKRTVNAWANVWRKWGEQNLPDRPKWSEAYERQNPTGATPASLDRAFRNMPPERKAAVVREHLADPKVADEVMNNPAARSHAREAISRSDERQQQYQQNVKPWPVEGRGDPEEEMVLTLMDFRRVQRILTDITQRLQRSTLIRASRDYQDGVLAQVGWDRNALDIIETLTNGGETTDEALARILEGGQL